MDTIVMVMDKDEDTFEFVPIQDIDFDAVKESTTVDVYQLFCKQIKEKPAGMVSTASH